MPHISVLFVVIVLSANLLRLVISWHSGLALEQARAQALATLAAAARPGVTVLERSADGSVVLVTAADGDPLTRSPVKDGKDLDELARL